jgi:signal transduction histidine kinase
MGAMSSDDRNRDGETRRAAAGPPAEAADTGIGVQGIGGLDPDALFAGATNLDERQALQWLGHLQRLASTGLLAGGITHDMAGLIQPLLGECERVLLKDDPTEYRSALVKIGEWARRSQEYTRALLDLVRRDQAQRASVPVEKVVEDTLRLVESTNRVSQVSIKRNLDNFHEALIDRTRLMQAVLNLVTNAIRAAARGGQEVEVGVRGRRDRVIVEVRDNGPGVPAEIEGRLFQPFVRGEPGSGAATQGTHHGTGLGLYITKRLVEDQGGRIEFETTQGVGSTFRLMLEPAPREKRPPGDALRGPAPEAGGKPE